MSVVQKRKPKVRIVYEDEFLLVVNKPAGWMVLRVFQNKGKNLQEYLEEKFNIKVAGRAGIVHRLDKGTSGILLVAKNKEVFDELQRQFKYRLVKKTYWALINGRLSGEGKILAPIGRLNQKRERKRFGVKPGGRLAETNFKVLENFRIDKKDFSLVEAKPVTGRTHQIRVHFKYLGHPLFGDSLYGGAREKEREIFLLAKEIKFTHPVTKKRMKFRIDLPEELKKVYSLAGKS